MNQKICLIYTGGTIGMSRHSNNVLHPPDKPDDFLKIVNSVFDHNDFDFVPLLNKDSTNMIPDDWKVIANAVYSRLNQNYAGFLIVHGTDTMHYSSSALAFAFGTQLNLPIVFTGSQTIFDVIHGDAGINLLRADLVARSRLAEVVISFNHSIYRGSRVIKTDERCFNAFESPGLGAIGDIGEHIQLAKSAKLKSGEREQDKIDFRGDFAEGILQVSAVPGFKPELLLPVIDSGDCTGLIVQSFGAGNIPNAGGYSWNKVINYTSERLIPVVISSAFAANSTLESDYGPGVSALESGAIAVGNMTQAATMVKLSWVLARVQRMIDEQLLAKVDSLKYIAESLQTNYVGEMY